MAAIQTTDEAIPRRGVSPAAWLLLAAWILLGVALWRTPAPLGLTTFAFVVVGWVLSVMAHEFAHAIVAYRAGDHTVAEKGYLTLDPFHFVHWATSIVIPLVILAIGGIGLPGGAVYLREDLMRSRRWRAAAILAGPFGTLLFLLFLAGALLIVRAAPGSGALAAALALLAFFQATALILNLLPIPGLDGYGALRPFLPPAVEGGLHRVEGLIFVGFLVLLLTAPGVTGVLFEAAFAISTALGVNPTSVALGFRAFEFWR